MHRQKPWSKVAKDLQVRHWLLLGPEQVAQVASQVMVLQFPLLSIWSPDWQTHWLLPPRRALNLQEVQKVAELAQVLQLAEQVWQSPFAVMK